MIDFIVQHQSWVAVAVCCIFSAAVSSLPDPAPGVSPGYLWVYRFSHTLAGNLTTAIKEVEENSV